MWACCSSCMLIYCLLLHVIPVMLNEALNNMYASTSLNAIPAPSLVVLPLVGILLSQDRLRRRS
ncbi:hypothetical protein GGR57DRAFT_183535 [Xylariaceae sp. FL1272]|nr:hypothetical protein GGR57DRAFT_183535 [Xylariaceae sp. FL1272]